MRNMYNILLILFVSFCLNCSSAVIKGPVSYSSSNWDVTILKLDTGLDKIEDDGTMTISQSFKDKNSPVKGYYDYNSSSNDFGSFRSHSKGSSPRSRGMKSGLRTTISSAGLILAPRYDDDTLMLMEIRIKNLTGTTREFDFKRVRLLFDNSVGRPYVLLTPEFIPKKRSFIVSVKPGTQATRRLIFVHTKKTMPYRVVYDNLNNGKITDKMSFAINAAEPEEVDYTQSY